MTRFVFSQWRSGPCVLDRDTDLVAPFVTDEFAHRSTERLNAECADARNDYYQDLTWCAAADDKSEEG